MLQLTPPIYNLISSNLSFNFSQVHKHKVKCSTENGQHFLMGEFTTHLYQNWTSAIPPPSYAEVRLCFFLAWNSNAWLDQAFKVWKTVPHGLYKQVVLLLSRRTVGDVGLARYSCVPRETRDLFFFLGNLVDQLAYILVPRESSQDKMTAPFVIQEQDNVLWGQVLGPKVVGNKHSECLQFTNCVLLPLRHQKTADGRLNCSTKPVRHTTGGVEKHSAHSASSVFTVEASICVNKQNFTWPHVNNSWPSTQEPSAHNT